MMKTFQVSLPDEMVTALETKFSAEEIPLIINQAVHREIEEWCRKNGINYSKACTSDECDTKNSQQDDANSQEWTH